MSGRASMEPMTSETPARPTRNAALMGAVTFGSRGIGFVRIWVVATVLGTTFLGNTYQGSSSVSNILFELLAAGALSAVLVPTFVKLFDSGDEEGAERLASGLLGIALVVLGAVAVCAFFLAPWIAELLSSGAPNAKTEAQQISLSTFLLRFFVFQVILYGVGTVSTAVLYAKRRTFAASAAPIANTVAVVIAMLVFRALAGGNPGLDLTNTERLVLALGGTIGVLGFVCVPTIALMRTGFRFRPRIGRPDDALRELLGHSTWAILQHCGIGILLATAMVMGNRVAGGVVAYQFAFVAIMAPYAILAMPIHTTILPDLTADAQRGDDRAFANTVRWALDSMALFVIPVSAAMVALALPAMRAIAVGDTNPTVLAAALASLALGLYPYSAFLLFARASYARGDSRTPAIVAVLTAIVGAVFIIVVGSSVEGNARVAALGFGHTVAYVLGAAVLGILLRRRLGYACWPPSLLKAFVPSVILACAGWWVTHTFAPEDRGATILMLVLIGGVGTACYLGVLRIIRAGTPDHPGGTTPIVTPGDPTVSP